MIAFLCSNCGAQLLVREEKAGKSGNCPRCRHRVEAPHDTPAGGDARSPSARPRPSPLPAKEEDRATESHEVFESEHSSARANLTFLAPAQDPSELGRLGNYRVLKILGAGGMGVVLEAEDVLLQRPVALKVLKTELAGNSEYRQRFLQEARAAAAIDHDHIVTIYQVGEDRNIPFLAMKLLQGESLEDCLNREGQLEVAEVLRIGREIAEGLAAAHARGLVHRDIKPANIWLEALPGGTRSRVRIVDFGLARGMADDVRLTQEGYMIGTPAYMSPEQAEGDAADHRTDLFSLGCVLYRMATGRLPFEGKSTMAVLMALASRNPKPPRHLVPTLPVALSDLILHLVNKKPGDRPSSARIVVEALTRIETEQVSAVSIMNIEEIAPVGEPGLSIPDEVSLSRISGDDLPPLQSLEPEPPPPPPAPAPKPPSRPAAPVHDTLEEVEEEEPEEPEESEEEEEEAEEKERRASKRKPVRKTSRPRKQRRQERPEDELARRVIILGVIVAVGVVALIIFLIVRHIIKSSEEKKTSFFPATPRVIQLAQAWPPHPLTATSAAPTPAGRRGGATSCAPDRP